MKKTLWIPAVLFALLFIWSCREGEKKAGVSVSIEPLKYFVDRLTSEQVEVNVMVPMGASPQTYSPTSKQLARVSSAGLYVQVGELGFEKAWMKKIRGFNKEMEVLNLSENLELIGGSDHDHDGHDHSEGKDPHIWMSPKVVKNFLPHLRDVLKKAFPEQSDVIDQNYPELYSEVENLDRKFSLLADSLKHKKFMIFHPALTYLARDYGFEQIAIEHEGKEPSPRKLREVIDKANDEGIRIIFIQAEFDERSARMVQDATGAELAVINPLAYKWKETMEEISVLFEEHLSENSHSLSKQ
ncbi:MAG: metal ABC transporter solute-binding protein, Zn/Mn family [Marinilabiliaceae bacterium]